MKKMKRKTIHNALPIVAAAYGEKFGVKVVVSGDDAYTDGKTVTIPRLPEDYPNMDPLWGFLAHECAHVRFTDFGVRRGTGLRSHLSNILEDLRIEQEMIREYPGTRQTLSSTAQFMAESKRFHMYQGGEHPGHVLAGYCLYWCRSQVLDQESITPFYESAVVALKNTFPKGVVVRINTLLRKAPSLQSTTEVLELTDEILKMLEEEQEKQDQNQKDDQDNQQGSSDDDSDNQDGDDDSQGSSSGASSDQDGDQDDDGSEAGTGQDKESSDDQDGSEQQSNAEEGQGDCGGDLQGGQSSEADSDDQDDASAISRALQATDEDLPQDTFEALKEELGKSAVSEESSGYTTVRQAIQAVKQDGTELSNTVKSTTAKIRAQLYGLVQASQRTGSRTKRSGKQLETRHLHRVLTGDTRVYRQSTDKQSPNTAVHIMVDMSSSMGYYQATDKNGNSKPFEDVAREAALALALALEPIPGVNPAVTYFCDDESTPVYSVVKHGERVAPNAGRFMLRPSGCTPMAEAIWYGAYELRKTREERKMMIVITDGEPNYDGPTKAVIELCENSGYDIVGIGIATTAVASLFKKHIIINDATDLQRTLFKLLEGALAPSVA